MNPSKDLVQKNSNPKSGRAHNTAKKLLDYFSNNQEAMDVFLIYCFMIQRVNTGGVNLTELSVIHSVKDQLIQTYQVDRESLRSIVQAINKDSGIYEIFATGSSELNYVKEQSPWHLCSIMSKYLPAESGLRLKITLTGDVDKDVEIAQNLLDLFTNTNIAKLLSISDDSFNLQFSNPWYLISQHIDGKFYTEPNTVDIICKHPDEEDYSYYIVKGLISILNSLSRRVEEAPRISEDPTLKERPSSLDVNLDRDAFMGIEPDFVTMSKNRPYQNSRPNSSIFSVKSVKKDEEEQEVEQAYQEEPQEDELAPEKGRVSRIKNLLGGIGKKVNSAVRGSTTSEKAVKPKEEEPITGITLMSANGVVFEAEPDLVWTFVEEKDVYLVEKKIYSQVFVFCPQVGLASIKPNVRDQIKGSWYDVAQGYLMSVNYKIDRQQED